MKQFLTLCILLISIQFCYCQNEIRQKPNKVLTVDTINNSIGDSIPVFYTFGLTTADRLHYLNVVGKKWGFKARVGTCCTVSKRSIDSVTNLNEKVYQYLTDKMGSDWPEKLKEEVDKEFEREITIDSYLRKQKFILKKAKKCKVKGFIFYLTPFKNNVDYYVSAESFSKLKGEDVWASYFRFIINVNTKKFKILEDEIIIVSIEHITGDY